MTVELAPTNPPYNWRVEVAKEPRAVTSAKVELEAAEATTQFVPSARHTRRPETKSCEVLTEPVTARLVVVTFAPVAFVKVTA